MPRLAGLAPIFVVFVLLAGCQTSLPGAGGSATPASDVTPNAIAGGEIEVTPLDSVAPDAAQTATGLDAADPPRDAEIAETQAELPDPAADVAEPAPVPAEEAAPAKPKSALQLACEKKGSLWVKAGKSTLMACVKTTRDSGKQCTNATQCESTCLARSGTCAPMKPLLGCNEVLQDNGVRVTQCID
jgi:hypothetical protein